MKWRIGSKLAARWLWKRTDVSELEVEVFKRFGVGDAYWRNLLEGWQYDWKYSSQLDDLLASAEARSKLEQALDTEIADDESKKVVPIRKAK